MDPEGIHSYSGGNGFFDFKTPQNPEMSQNDLLDER
jgi:hypothetical protein